jgi:hypothetical protein
MYAIECRNFWAGIFAAESVSGSQYSGEQNVVSPSFFNHFFRFGFPKLPFVSHIF